ncbi:hypothetical protein ONZ45_g1491 [Pleurotus djamor]|nr:hypothetical protein ONZ45_g1491 [Pleurotus djamor]
MRGRLAKNTGAIIGISIAAILVLIALVVALFFFVVRRRRRGREYTYGVGASSIVGGGGGGAGGRRSALRNLLGGSPSFGRTTGTGGSMSSTSSLGLGMGGAAGAGVAAEEDEGEGSSVGGRPVMAGTRGSGISLGSQFSLEDPNVPPAHFQHHQYLHQQHLQHLQQQQQQHLDHPHLQDSSRNPSPVSHNGDMDMVQVGRGVSIVGGVGIALTTRDSAMPESYLYGHNRTTSGRAPILYQTQYPSLSPTTATSSAPPPPPSGPIATNGITNGNANATLPPSSYHWKSTTSPVPPHSTSPSPTPSHPDHPTAIRTRSPTPQLVRTNNSSNESTAFSPSPEVVGYYALGSSSGHDHSHTPGAGIGYGYDGSSAYHGTATESSGSIEAWSVPPWEGEEEEEFGCGVC